MARQGEFSPIDFRWEIQNQKDLQAGFKRLEKVTSDFSIPFRLIGSDWFRSNKQLFTLQSSGLYQDLAPATGAPTTTSDYKAQKKKRLGFIYPIFRGKTGRIEDALLQKGSAGNVFHFGHTFLHMGISDSAVPYAKYHQSDRSRRVMPQRKLVFITGGPADRSSDSRISGRRERWLNIINKYALDQIKEGL